MTNNVPVSPGVFLQPIIVPILLPCMHMYQAGHFLGEKVNIPSEVAVIFHIPISI
jgi:hypothetical protein